MKMGKNHGIPATEKAKDEERREKNGGPPLNFG